MKRLGKIKEVECQGCLDCVSACSESFHKIFHPDKSNIQVVMKKGEPTPSYCVQCGKCAKVCEFGAITENKNGVWMVNKKLCQGCGKCVEACPLKLVVLNPETNIANKCIVCGKCVKMCPMGCLEIVEK